MKVLVKITNLFLIVITKTVCLQTKTAFSSDIYILDQITPASELTEVQPTDWQVQTPTQSIIAVTTQFIQA